MEKENIVGYLKVTGANIRTLHRHLIGGQWFENHERLGEYYEKIDEIEDAVCENLIALGMNDISISDACEMYVVLEIKTYTAGEAFGIVKQYFERLLDMFKRFKESADELPDAVKSKFEEFEQWLFLESKYKLTKMLQKTDLSELFK